MKPTLDHLTTGPNASLSLPAAAVEQEKRKLTAREKRFIKFSSVEYDGQIYMTPQGILRVLIYNFLFLYSENGYNRSAETTFFAIIFKTFNY